MEQLLLAESTNLKRKFKAPLTVINKVLSVEFDDGYLFGAHPVTVKVRRNGTPASLELDA